MGRTQLHVGGVLATRDERCRPPGACRGWVATRTKKICCPSPTSSAARVYLHLGQKTGQSHLQGRICIYDKKRHGPSCMSGVDLQMGQKGLGPSYMSRVDMQFEQIMSQAKMHMKGGLPTKTRKEAGLVARGWTCNWDKKWVDPPPSSPSYVAMMDLKLGQNSCVSRLDLQLGKKGGMLIFMLRVNLQLGPKMCRAQLHVGYGLATETKWAGPRFTCWQWTWNYEKRAKAWLPIMGGLVTVTKRG